MVRNRKGLAPWSLSREAGIESATVDGTIEVPQYVQPVLDTGFVDEKGDWKGAKSSDKDFIAFQTDSEIANTASFVTPSAPANSNVWPLDMTGYCGLFFAIKPTNGGAYKIQAVMGPADLSFANLSPVNAAAILKGTRGDSGNDFDDLFSDSAETMTADVWNIFSIMSCGLQDQKLLRFKITNAN